MAFCAITTLSLSACDLLEPSDIVNPNVDEDTFKNSSNALKTWINGTNSTFATTRRGSIARGPSRRKGAPQCLAKR